jgi:hypothetical protein
MHTPEFAPVTGELIDRLRGLELLRAQGWVGRIELAVIQTDAGPSVEVRTVGEKA